MDSDESRHSESEFYYPEEKTLNQMLSQSYHKTKSGTHR